MRSAIVASDGPPKTGPAGESEGITGETMCFEWRSSHQLTIWLAVEGYISRGFTSFWTQAHRNWRYDLHVSAALGMDVILA